MENSWLRTEHQLNLLHRVAATLDERHRDLQQETLQVLAMKLELVILKLQSVLEPDTSKEVGDGAFKVKRVKYLFLKETIDEAISSLKLWQDVFDPSWFLMMKAATPQLDKELLSLENDSRGRTIINSAIDLRAAVSVNEQDRTTIWLPPNGLDSFMTTSILHSDAKFVLRPGSGNSLILDEVPRPPGVNTNTSKKAIATLARKLAKSDPATFGLLTCKGVVLHEPRKGEVTGFTLVHRVPKDYCSPRSLRAYLLDQGSVPHSLSDRLQLAKDLVKAVGYVHTFGFVHKNIRPETIVVFENAGSSIGSVSLVGFEDFRSEDGRTYRSGDEQGEKNLYRHPKRQGTTPQEDYVMQHDIYSLGVCLLEIGSWGSLLRYEQDNDVYTTSAGELLPAHALTKDGLQAVKDVLITLASEHLPSKVGNKYAQIVATCLTCLDEGNADFGDESEFADQDGVLVGVRFIQKVSDDLHSYMRLTDTGIVAHEDQWNHALSLSGIRKPYEGAQAMLADDTKRFP